MSETMTKAQVEKLSELIDDFMNEPDNDDYEAQDEPSTEDYQQRIRELSDQHDQLVAALRALVAANNCNYDRDTMRSEGLFRQAEQALAGEATNA